MKPLTLCILLILLTNCAFGQNSKIDICDVYRHAITNQSHDTITYLLQLDTTQVSNYEKSELLTMRAKLYFYLDQDNIDKKESSDQPTIVKAYKDLSLAIDQYEDEKDRLRYVFRRFVTLKDYKPHYEEYESDLALLSSSGFKNDRFGFSLTAVSKYDGNFWLGLEATFLGGFSNPYILKDGYNQIIHQQETTVSASALVFGYARNIESNMNDINFTLLRLEAPLFIDVTQFGLITSEGSSHWYYRPELGVGHSIFHLSAGYSIFFKANKSKELSNSIVNFRIKHTF